MLCWLILKLIFIHLQTHSPSANSPAAWLSIQHLLPGEPPSQRQGLSTMLLAPVSISNSFHLQPLSGFYTDYTFHKYLLEWSFLISMFSILFKSNFWYLHYKCQNSSFQQGLPQMNFCGIVSFSNTVQNPVCKCLLSEIFLSSE